MLTALPIAGFGERCGSPGGEKNRERKEEGREGVEREERDGGGDCAVLIFFLMKYSGMYHISHPLIDLHVHGSVNKIISYLS